MSKTKKKIIIVVNVVNFFLSHRLPIALAAKEKGFDIHIATADGPDVERIKTLGFIHHEIPFNRKGQNPFYELKTLVLLFRLFWRLKPDLAHLVTVKPVLYGGIAAQLAGVKSVVAAISGMGTVFIADTLKAKLRRTFILYLYKVALNHKHLKVIIQNHTDKDILLKNQITTKKHIIIIRGSGVNLADYPATPEPKTPPVVVMASRLLKDKGVFEFAEAAKILKSRRLNVEMRLIGDIDPGNQTSLSQADLNRLTAEKNIEIMGYRNDIAQQYAQAHIVCLPSYREGLPKSLIEAAACSRAIVTTDTPGCRDAIIPDRTGLLVPIKEAKPLAEALQKLIEDKNLRTSMGTAGRILAEKEFAIDKIIKQHLDIYKEMLG